MTPERRAEIIKQAGIAADELHDLVPAIESKISLLESKIAKAVEALEEIALGRGKCDEEPLKHAANCIDEMKAIARTTLAMLKGETT